MQEIFKRRSIRKYTNQKIEKEKIEKLLRAGMQAPSAYNQQPWEFIVIENKEKLKKLSEMNPFSHMVEKAPLALVLLANKNALKVPSAWQQDLSAATQNILLEAVTLNLGAVWIGVSTSEENIAYIKDMFNLDDTLKPFCVISLGYPADGQENKYIDRYDKTKVSFEK